LDFSFPQSTTKTRAATTTPANNLDDDDDSTNLGKGKGSRGMKRKRKGGVMAMGKIKKRGERVWMGRWKREMNIGERWWTTLDAGQRDWRRETGGAESGNIGSRSGREKDDWLLVAGEGLPLFCESKGKRIESYGD